MFYGLGFTLSRLLYIKTNHETYKEAGWNKLTTQNQN